MQKQKKQFILLCAAVVVFCGAFFTLKAYNVHVKEKEAAQADAGKITILTMDTDKIDEFTYQYEGEEITFVKKDDTWYYQPDESIKIIQTAIPTVLSCLKEVTADQQITGVEDISEYGFDEPSNVIRVKVGEDEVTITIGMYNEITSQYYLMINGDSNVYAADSTVSSSFEKSVEDLTSVEDADTDEAE